MMYTVYINHSSMELSIFVAQVMAIYFVILGVVALVNHKKFAKFVKDFKKNKLFLFFGASLDLFFGVILVVAHNIWVWDWPLVITILGWLWLIEGTLVMLLPGKSLKLALLWRNKGCIIATSIIAIVIGLLLGWMAWF